MKLIGLFLALGVVAMIGVMMIAMSAHASADVSSAARSPALDAHNVFTRPVADDLFLAGDARAVRSQADEPTQAQPLRSETERRNSRKRSGSRCARVTTICWVSA